MTKAKKMLGMVMAALLCFALTPMAAFAAVQPMTGSGNVKETRGTITITNAIPDQEYKLYEIFQLESYNNEAKAYSYKLVSDGWRPFFQGVGADYASINDQGYVTWKKTATGENGEETAGGAEFAKAAIAYATANGISWTTSAVASAAADGAETVELTFSNLELGYYLVSSSIGTICSLDSTHSDAKITDKNEKPSIVKEVQENSKEDDAEQNNGWGSDNNANIGETVSFRSTITGQAGARSYVFHDTMSAGLTFIPSSVAITLNGNDIADTTYTVKTDPTDDCTFEVVFTQDFCNTIAANNKIVVSYQATLNENAVISGDANTNVSKLSYGSDDRTVTTPGSTTKTYTGGFNVFKYTGDEPEKGTPLAGAVFTVSKLETGSNPLSFVKLDASDPRAVDGVPTYRPVVDGETDGITEIKTIDNGKFKIVGLDKGEYFLTEITAPDGYNKLAAAQSVMVSENENGYSVLDFGNANVQNKTGLELPSTGGIGTMILYVIGGLLVLGAIVVLVRRRSSAK